MLAETYSTAAPELIKQSTFDTPELQIDTGRTTELAFDPLQRESPSVLADTIVAEVKKAAVPTRPVAYAAGVACQTDEILMHDEFVEKVKALASTLRTQGDTKSETAVPICDLG